MILNKLFCTHSHNKVILWYSTIPSSWDNYAIQTHKTEICKRCGRAKTKTTGERGEIFSGMFNYKKMLLESQGYLTEREYLDEMERMYH